MFKRVIQFKHFNLNKNKFHKRKRDSSYRYNRITQLHRCNGAALSCRGKATVAEGDLAEPTSFSVDSISVLNYKVERMYIFPVNP